LFRGFAIPFDSFAVIHGDSRAVLVFATQLSLRFGIALFGGLAAPF